jgi:leucyl/phenylalanyl-tRNA--protein transferase
MERFGQGMDFPPVDHALDNGLLAVGGDLSVPRLITAYRRGIFPWYGPGDPILWWSPDPRLVLLPVWLHVPRSLRRVLNQQRFAFSLDRDFEGVIRGCAEARRDDGTWLVPEMVAGYLELHQAGYAHSLEVWRQGRLAGGIYGVALGNCFFGESMFTRVPDASKAGLVELVRWLACQGFELIDCQVTTAHLLRFGAREIRRGEFLARLEHALRAPDRIGRWEFQI